MKRRQAMATLVALATFRCVRGQSSSVPRIGVLYHSGPYAVVVEGLREGLRQLGLQEQRDLILDIRDGQADPRAIESIARAFEREKVKLIYAVPMTATLAVKRATSEVPIVFCVGSDPVAAGLVASFAKPAGRLTGVHYLRTDLTGKRLELLQALLPELRRVIIFYDPANPVAQTSARMARDAARELGVELVENPVHSIAELRRALRDMRGQQGDALLQTSDAMVTSQAAFLVERARELRLPTMVFEQSVVEGGALASYGVDTREAGRLSAKHVQRILAGAAAGELPVENVTRLVFALNRRTAQQIGLAVPASTLVRFDRIIE